MWTQIAPHTDRLTDAELADIIAARAKDALEAGTDPVSLVERTPGSDATTLGDSIDKAHSLNYTAGQNVVK